MKPMKTDRALEEVREWKEQIRLQEESWGVISIEKRVSRINDEADVILEKWGINLKIKQHLDAIQ